MLFGRHLRENLTLNRTWTQWYSLDHACIEQVKSSINFIAYERRGLLNKFFYLPVRLSNDDSILRGIFYLGYDDSTLLSMVLVELDQLV